MRVEIVGECCSASGENWHYEQVGHIKVFTQTGKVPSLRVIRTVIKEINKIALTANLIE